MRASTRLSGAAPVRVGDVLTTVADRRGGAGATVLRPRTTVHRADGTTVVASESTVKLPRELDGPDATRSG